MTQPIPIETNDSPLSSVPKSRIIRLFKSLEIGASPMRVQDPSILQTDGSDSKWYIKPYVDTFDENGNAIREQKRIYLGRVDEVGKREAIKKKNEIMAKINQSDFVLQSQVRFGEFLDTFVKEYVEGDNLSLATQDSYCYFIENYIRPSFDNKMMCEVTTREIDALMKRMQAKGLSYQTRKACKGVISKVFNQAERWGIWKERSPTKFVSLGRKKKVFEDRLWSTEETVRFFDALPDDVRLVCEVALYCTLRIGEVLGIQWKHVDMDKGIIYVRQQKTKGEVKELKTEDSNRNVAIGVLRDDLLRMYNGQSQDAFVFMVKKPDGKLTNNTSDIRRLYLRPIAEKTGLYVKGFGFHHFRRESITEMGGRLGSLQTQRMAGHTTEGMSLKYTQADLSRQEVAVRENQERVRGKVVEIRKGVA